MGVIINNYIILDMSTSNIAGLNDSANHFDPGHTLEGKKHLVMLTFLLEMKWFACLNHIIKHISIKENHNWWHKWYTFNDINNIY